MTAGRWVCLIVGIGIVVAVLVGCLTAMWDSPDSDIRTMARVIVVGIPALLAAVGVAMMIVYGLTGSLS